MPALAGIPTFMDDFEGFRILGKEAAANVVGMIAGGLTVETEAEMQH